MAQLRTEGWTQVEIAEELKTPLGTIQGDIRAIKKQWMENAEKSWTHHVANELGELNMVMRTAWKAWRNSIGVTEEVTYRINDDGERVPTQVKTKILNGDSRYLTLITQAMKQREYLLGLLDRNQVQELGGMGTNKAKILVVRDRQQLNDLVDVTTLQRLEVVDSPEVKPHVDLQDDAEGQ